MAAMRAKNSRPELAVRSVLHRAGFRFRLHRRDLPGRPDIVLPRFRRIVLVHGCFFHGHGCHRSTIPKHNAESWAEKIRRNQARDARVVQGLEALGWRVTVLWQCVLDDGIRELIEDLNSGCLRRHEQSEVRLGG